MADFSDFHKSLNADPAKRGKQFEYFVKWFLTNEPEWATQVAQVWLWDEYPERWGVDCGIDLVFKHKNGELWAVQAKCYSPDYDITKHDVDKFLSESSRSSISKRLLIATTDGIGANAKQVCYAQEKSVVRYLLSNFEGAEIDYPARMEDLYQAKLKERPTPRPHQHEAIVATVENFTVADRGQLIMACGTGKTYVTLWIKEKLDARSTLVLVPSLSLLSQTLKEWTFAATQPFDVLCVCSDQTVGKRGEDEIIHSVADLAFPVTSNVDEIRQFLQGEGDRVVFSTYQSSLLIAEAQAMSPQPPLAPPCQGENLFLSSPDKGRLGGVLEVPPFDLIIADEAHRCSGKADRDFSAVLDGNLIRANKRLFVTATPRTYAANVHKAAEERGVEVFGMDDEAVFGKVFYSLPFPKAIQRGLLTDYRVVIIGVDDPTIAEWIKNREIVKPKEGEETDAESLAAQIGLLKAIKDYDLKRVISFHSRVKRAEEFASDIQDVLSWVEDQHKPSGNLWFDFVSGVMPTSKRKQKLDRLKAVSENQRGILSNARCLSEGVDVPSLDGVAFIDPKNSQVDIIQAVGRAIRLSADKKFGTIVLPVFIRQGEDAVSSIEASNFKPVWDVLNALKSHDEELAYQLDQLRTEMGRRSGAKVGADAFGKIIIDLPATVDASFGDALRTYLVEQTTASWNFWFGLLEEFVKKNGDARVPGEYKTPESYKLGYWVAHQRSSRSKDNLSEDRVVRLESLSGWSWDPYLEQWENGFGQLEHYVKLNGNTKVPRGYVTENDYRLGIWVRAQRKSKSTNLLSQNRIERLELLPGWSWDLYSEKWEEGFKQLEQYAIFHGNTRVLQGHVTTEGFTLGVWVGYQRKSKLKKLLSKDYIEQLEALPGWSWDPISEKWDEWFEQLVLYVNLIGNAKVPNGYITPQSYRLGQWVGNQRQLWLNKQISPDRIKRLASLPGWSWDLFSEQWDEWFVQLEKYVTLHGNARAYRDYVCPDGYKLGAWVSAQRKLKLNNQLTQNRIHRLESLPGWLWDPISEQWEEGFRQLVQYVTQNGNARVSDKHVTSDGYKLGNWIRGQRQNKSKNRISQNLIERIESLPGWSWDPHTEQWEEGFSQLKQYVSQHGNAKMPGNYVTSEGYKLRLWVNSQRSSRNSSQLSPVRIERLESLAGWSWDPLAEKWEEGFRQLVQYANQHGNARVPRDYVSPDGYQLGSWVSTKRKSRSENQLSQNRVEQLGSLPGWSWDPLSEQWVEGFSQLREYITQHGDARVPDKYVSPDGYKLGVWVRTQRANKSKNRINRMSQERMQRLESFPDWVWAVSAR